MNNNTKPPIGIIPRNIWLEQRLDELTMAIMRYANAGLTIPPEWITEYNNLIVELF